MLLKLDITERFLYEHPDVYNGYIDVDQINIKFVDKIFDMVIMLNKETNHECSLHDVVKLTYQEVNFSNTAFRNMVRQAKLRKCTHWNTRSTSNKILKS